jgi:starvation-inducible DNA-binding protein
LARGTGFGQAVQTPCERSAEVAKTIAHATHSEYAKLSSIKETPGVPEAKEMVRILVEGQEAVARTARKIFPVVDKASDEPTADLLTQRMQVHEKTAWMLRSLLEA